MNVSETFKHGELKSGGQVTTTHQMLVSTFQVVFTRDLLGSDKKIVRKYVQNFHDLFQYSTIFNIILFSQF